MNSTFVDSSCEQSHKVLIYLQCCRATRRHKGAVARLITTKALRTPLRSISILVSVSDFKQDLAFFIASIGSFLAVKTLAYPYTEEALCILRRNDENTLHIELRAKTQQT